jgi:hypothetical protein
MTLLNLVLHLHIYSLLFIINFHIVLSHLTMFSNKYLLFKSINVNYIDDFAYIKFEHTLKNLLNSKTCHSNKLPIQSLCLFNVIHIRLRFFLEK